MKKHNLIQALRIIAFLSVAPLIYLFWERSGEGLLTSSIHPPLSVNAIPIGGPAPAFTIAPENTWVKQPLSLASFRGKPLIVHFWATWCGPCLLELPELIAAASSWRTKGYSVITVAVDDSWATVEKFLQQNPKLKGLTETTALVLDPESKLATSFGSSRFPETFLINDQMLIDNKLVGAQPWLDARMAPYLNALTSVPPN